MSDRVTTHLVPFPMLTQAQCDAIAELSATLKPERKLSLLQTYTESGGTHLYVRIGEHDEYHVATNGNVVTLNVPVDLYPAAVGR